MRGAAKFGGGVAENGDFRQGGHYHGMILAFRVIGIVPLPLSDRPLSDSGTGRHLLGLGLLPRRGRFQARPTLANAAYQKRPSARRVSPARVVQIERTTTSPKRGPTSLEPFRPSRPSWPSPCTSGNNHSNSKGRKRTSRALA